MWGNPKSNQAFFLFFFYLAALLALCGVFLLEAWDAEDVVLVGYDEWLRPHSQSAARALETFVVPLPVLVLHLLSSRSRYR